MSSSWRSFFIDHPKVTQGIGSHSPRNWVLQEKSRVLGHWNWGSVWQCLVQKLPSASLSKILCFSSFEISKPWRLGRWHPHLSELVELRTQLEFWTILEENDKYPWPYRVGKVNFPSLILLKYPRETKGKQRYWMCTQYTREDSGMSSSNGPLGLGLMGGSIKGQQSKGKGELCIW